MPVQQFNYGQNYGDWRSYAGYTDKDTGQYNFGVDPNKNVAPTPVAPPTPTDNTMGVPAQPTMGVAPKKVGMGMSPADYSFGGTSNDLLNAVNKHLFGE
jgi:hypothetical protein